MLLEWTERYSNPHNREYHSKTTSAGTLDATSRKYSSGFKLITAMLAERPFQTRAVSSMYYPSSSNTYSYSTISNSGNDSYTYNNMAGQHLVNHLTANVSAPTSPNSVNRSPEAPILTTCIVAPAENNLDYKSTDEDSISQFESGHIPSRKQREFIPENKKDDGYWEKRRKNNEAARRSREKRRVHDMALENRIMELTRDNCKLRNELILVKKNCGLSLDDTFVGDEPEESSRVARSANTSQAGSFAQAKDHSELLQPTYTVVMPQSPIRCRNISSPLKSPYPYSYPQSNGTPISLPLPPTMEPFYVNRDKRASDIDFYSEKFEDESQGQLKSIKNISHIPQMRVDNQLRPPYSSALPPNQISPYNALLPVSLQKSYWIPTTDLTSSDSNDEGGERYGQVQEQPLSLVKKRPSTETAESSSDISSCSSGTSCSSASSSTLPLKLRHKISHESSSASSPLLNVFQNGLNQHSGVPLAHPGLVVPSTNEYEVQNSYESLKKRPRNFSNPRSPPYDQKYVERRRKNNEAARKCRENRKHLTKFKEVKSGYLENENDQLKDELLGLQEEMRELRGLLEKKQKKQEVEVENKPVYNDIHPDVCETKSE